MAQNKKPVKVFKSVMSDAPPNPFRMLFALPVALYCVLVSYFHEKYDRTKAANCKGSNR